MIVCNCHTAGPVRYLGERAIDRLSDNGLRIVICDWASYHRIQQKAELLQADQHPGFARKSISSGLNNAPMRTPSAKTVAR